MIRLLLITAFTIELLLTDSPGYAQNQSETNLSVGKFVRVKDERALSDNDNMHGVKYSDVTGTPFWTNDYRNGMLFKNNLLVGTTPVKINLFTNEIYFLKGNQELVLADSGINKIVFATTKDTISFVRSVPNLFLNGKIADGFAQVLNSGKYQLLKYIKKEVLTGDSALLSKRYYFKETNYYYFKKNQQVEKIKKLDEENVLVHLPLSGTLKKWIDANDINFKREKDLVRLLNHYNLMVASRN